MNDSRRLLLCAFCLVLSLGCSATLSRNAIKTEPEGPEGAASAGDYKVSYDRDAESGMITVQIHDQQGRPHYLDIDRLECELSLNDGRRKLVWLDGEGFYPELTDYDYRLYPWSEGATAYSSRFGWARDERFESARVWVPLPDGSRHEIVFGG